MRLWRLDEPIVQDMFEDDVYKFTMGNFIRQFFPNVRVRFRLIVRNNTIRMTDYIDVHELKKHIAHAGGLRFSETDHIPHLRSWGIFPESYLRYLLTVRMAPIDVWSDPQGAVHVETEGLWFEASLWEMRVLRIIQTLYTHEYAKKHGIREQALVAEGDRRLTAKLELLRAHPRIAYAAFWMRRAASGSWDEHVTERAVSETPRHIIGVSNVYLARRFNKEPMGTRAHELDMVVAALRRLESDVLVRHVPYEIMRKWRMTYGHRLLIMLGDTFGTAPFLKRLPPELAGVYRGFRLDSGDPLEEGEKYLTYYNEHGINASEKLAIPSDSLNVPLMIKLEEHFRGRVLMSFGVGTDFSNDLGIPPLPAVMKPIESAGHPVVKLSNNLAKGTGSAAERTRIAKIFGYDVSFSEQPKF